MFAVLICVLYCNNYTELLFQGIVEKFGRFISDGGISTYILTLVRPRKLFLLWSVKKSDFMKI